MVALDVLSIGALIAWPPPRGNARISFYDASRSLLVPSPAVLTWLAVVLLFGVPAAMTMSSYEPGGLIASGDLTGDVENVVLHPTEWVGQKLPLLGHIDIGNRLEKGNVTLILFRHDCPVCDEMVQAYSRRAATNGMVNGSRVALISIPPHELSSAEAPHLADGFLMGKLSSATRWIIETPTLLSLHDGAVIGVVVGSARPDAVAARTDTVVSQ